jgi:SOS-response transcriptional repressor LexA
MPSYSELTTVIGFRSKHAAYHLVTRLIDQGWLEKDAAGTLLPGPHFHTVPVLGTVTAGFPSPAEEELADTMSLDEYLITNKEATEDVSEVLVCYALGVYETQSNPQATRVIA